MRLFEREVELATVRAFVRRGGILVVEGRAGIGKTAILDATCIAAQRVGRLVLRARGCDLESDFVFGIARQLLERWCTDTSSDDRAVLFSGSAGTAKALLMPSESGRKEDDTSFALVHGATGWQQHSVRGFLAGVVRKRLKLKLGSTKVDGNRVYRVTSADGGKFTSRQSKRRSA